MVAGVVTSGGVWGVDAKQTEVPFVYLSSV